MSAWIEVEQSLIHTIATKCHDERSAHLRDAIRLVLRLQPQVVQHRELPRDRETSARLPMIS